MIRITRAYPSALALTLLACGGDSSRKPDGGIGNDGGHAGSEAGVSDARVGAAVDGSTASSANDADVMSSEDAGTVDSGIMAACDASTAPVIPALKLQPVADLSSLSRIVFAAQPPGSTDWYLVLQTGTIRVVSNGQLQPKPFLDVTSQIDPGIGPDDERGLLSLAFPPDYATSGKFYVVLTPTITTDGFPSTSDSVIEYQKGADANTAPTRLRTIVQLPPSETNHNGGTVVFGNDGLLYYGTGDGGGACNNNGEAQEPQQLTVDKLHGKILRFDPRLTTAPYAAAGNPFAGMSGADPRIYHIGLRNPFRFGFDRLTGDMFIGDVGQDTYEEVDFAPVQTPGLNFGWPAYEGAHMYTCGSDAKHQLLAGSTATPPIVDIPRANNAPPPFGDYVSVMGGYVYRGNAIPGLQGVYLFGDYKGKRFGALRQCGRTTSPVTPINKNKDPNSSAAYFAQASGAPAFNTLFGIVQDNANELYFVANGNSLLKLVPGP